MISNEAQEKATMDELIQSIESEDLKNLVRSKWPELSKKQRQDISAAIRIMQIRHGGLWGNLALTEMPQEGT